MVFGNSLSGASWATNVGVSSAHRLVKPATHIHIIFQDGPGLCFCLEFSVSFWSSELDSRGWPDPSPNSEP